MFRIKDPKASLKFYTEILGMELVKKADGGDFVSTSLSYCNRTTSIRSKLNSVRDLLIIPP
jgi:lactoylglutathione lyase